MAKPIVVGGCVTLASLLAGNITPVQAQLKSKQIPAYIPKLTEHTSPAVTYIIAGLALTGVTVATFRSAHRGTRGGGREK